MVPLASSIGSLYGLGLGTPWRLVVGENTSTRVCET